MAQYVRRCGLGQKKLASFAARPGARTFRRESFAIVLLIVRRRRGAVVFSWLQDWRLLIVRRPASQMHPAGNYLQVAPALEIAVKPRGAAAGLTLEARVEGGVRRK